jgi:hypothetical protein
MTEAVCRDACWLLINGLLLLLAADIQKGAKKEIGVHHTVLMSYTGLHAG